jgi:hypothetical protein
MKVYLVVNAPASMRWQASQAEAKRLARAYGGEINDIRVAEEGREELAAFLNGRELFVQPATQLDEGISEAADHWVKKALPIVQPAATSEALNPTLLSVEEFIQQADGGALASIASNVCWRIKELTKSSLLD